MPDCHPSLPATHGVITGASKPTPFPPVFITAALAPPRCPPTSTAVCQKAASLNPSVPRAAVKQTTVQPWPMGAIPLIRKTTAPSIAPPATRDRPARQPQRAYTRDDNHPPSGIVKAIANVGSAA